MVQMSQQHSSLRLDGSIRCWWSGTSSVPQSSQRSTGARSRTNWRRAANEPPCGGKRVELIVHHSLKGRQCYLHLTAFYQQREWLKVKVRLIEPSSGPQDIIVLPAGPADERCRIQSGSVQRPTTGRATIVIGI